MKKYQLHTNAENILSRFPVLCKRLEAAEHAIVAGETSRILCLGADLEKAGACVAVQIGLGEPITLGTLARDSVLKIVLALRQRQWRCVLAVEACGFGWLFQRQLRQAGAEVLTFATEALSGRRKTNSRDAAALARLIGDRIIYGNLKAGRIVREPSTEEQQRRFLSRHRAQLIGLRGKVEAQGRGLMLDFGLLDFPECWWGKKMWPRLAAQLTRDGHDWLQAALLSQQAIARSLHTQILELDRQLGVLAPQQLSVALPHGLGTLTALSASLEVMDWHRFGNRKQVGSFIGCTPSEHSTGPGQVLGGIDRQGNRRLRSLLTEAVWRLLRWEPSWQGFKKWGPVIRDHQGSSVRKKKAVIACVRLLFIDLWRLFTKRATLSALGFRGSPAATWPEERTRHPQEA